MSFFYPKKEDKTKKPEKETPSSVRETEPPPKVALKERNREVPDSDSPVKRAGRKAARVLCSEEEEEDEALMSPKSQKPALDSAPVSSPSPVTFPESSRSLSSTSPTRTSPSGIPKRRTARKQLSKRTIQNVLEEQSEDKDGDAKRKKEEGAEAESLPEPEEAIKKETEERDPPTATPEPPETCRAEPPTESSSESAVAIKQEPQEEDPAKPPRAPRTLSSFFRRWGGAGWRVVVGWGTGPTISWLHSQPPGSQQSKKK